MGSTSNNKCPSKKQKWRRQGTCCRRQRWKAYSHKPRSHQKLEEVRKDSSLEPRLDFGLWPQSCERNPCARLTSPPCFRCNWSWWVWASSSPRELKAPPRSSHCSKRQCSLRAACLQAWAPTLHPVDRMVPSEVWAPSVRGEAVSSSAGWCQCRFPRGIVVRFQLDNVGNVPHPAPEGWRVIGSRHPREIRNILERDCNAISSDLIKFLERRQQDGYYSTAILGSSGQGNVSKHSRNRPACQHHAGVLAPAKGWWALPLSGSCHLPVSIERWWQKPPEKGFCLLDTTTRLQAKDKG